MLNAARRAFHATRRQLSSSVSSDAIPAPPTAALAKRSQLLRDVRSQRPFLNEGSRARASRGAGVEVASYVETPSTLPRRIDRAGRTFDLHTVHEVPRRARGFGFALGEGDARGLREKRTGPRAPRRARRAPHGVAQPARRAPPRGRGRGRRGPLLAGRVLIVMARVDSDARHLVPRRAVCIW